MGPPRRDPYLSASDSAKVPANPLRDACDGEEGPAQVVRLPTPLLHRTRLPATGTALGMAPEESGGSWKKQPSVPPSLALHTCIQLLSPLRVSLT